MCFKNVFDLYDQSAVFTAVPLTVTIQLAETDKGSSSDLQVITAVPSLRALRFPLSSTLTTLLSEDDQETVLSTAPVG